MMTTVTYQEKEYRLYTLPAPTNRVFPGCFADAIDDDDEYIMEYSAGAEGDDGEDYVIRWQFDMVLGQEPELSDLDWDNVHSVIHAS